MVLPSGIDVAIAVEQLVPQAAFYTARATNIDVDDYAALERTWYDSRPIPTRGQLIGAYNAWQAQQNQANNDRVARKNDILLKRQTAILPTTGEIQSITSLADAKQVILQLRANLAYFEVVLKSLQIDRELFE